MNSKTYLVGVSVALFSVGAAGSLHAQAGPGPIMPSSPSNPAPSNTNAAPQIAQPPANRPEPRTSIVGQWTLQRDANGADQRGRGAQGQNRRNGGNGPVGGNGGNGPYGGN